MNFVKISAVCTGIALSFPPCNSADKNISRQSSRLDARLSLIVPAGSMLTFLACCVVLRKAHASSRGNREPSVGRGLEDDHNPGSFIDMPLFGPRRKCPTKK